MNAVDVRFKAIFVREIASTLVTNESAVTFAAVLEELIFCVKFLGANNALEVGILLVCVRLSYVLLEFFIGLGYSRAKATGKFVTFTIDVIFSHMGLVLRHTGISFLAYNAQIIVHHSSMSLDFMTSNLRNKFELFVAKITFVKVLFAAVAHHVL